MANEINAMVSYCFVCGQRVRREGEGWVHEPFPDGHDAEPLTHHARTCQDCEGTHRCRECAGKGAVGMIMCPLCEGDGGCACVHPRERGSW